MNRLLIAFGLIAVLALHPAEARDCEDPDAQARAHAYAELADAAIARGDGESLWFAALMRRSAAREQRCEVAGVASWMGEDQFELLEPAAQAAWSDPAVLLWITDMLPPQPGADRGLATRISARLLELEPGNLTHWDLALRLAARSKASSAGQRELILRAAQATATVDAGYGALSRAINRQLAMQPLPSALGRHDPYADVRDVPPDALAFLKTASDEDIRLLVGSGFLIAWPLNRDTLVHCSKENPGEQLDPKLHQACMKLAEVALDQADTVLTARMGSGLKARLSADPADREAAIELHVQLSWLQSVFAHEAQLQNDLLAPWRAFQTEGSTELSVLRETAARLGLETPSPEFVREQRSMVAARFM